MRAINILLRTYKYLLLLLPFLAVAKPQKDTINIYTYHLKPPFIIDQKNQAGLYYDFSNYLNLLQNKYRFKTVFMPKKRIDKYLNKDKLNGILIGVNPKWFNDTAEDKYHWTVSILQDQDEVVSLKSSPITYQGPQSLIGLSLGGVFGFKYVGIDQLTDKKKIKRINTIGDQQILTLIEKKRVDVGIVSGSTIRYLASNNHNLKSKFYISPQPHYAFERRVLFPKSLIEVFNNINPLLTKPENYYIWSKVLSKYQLQNTPIK